MAQVAFRYVESRTAVHGLDPRTKLLLLIAGTVVAVGRDWPGLIIFFPIVLAGLFLIRVPLKPLVSELRGFLLFFLFILLVSSINISRSGPFPIGFDTRGFYVAALTVSRMVFVILISVLFTAVTKIREMRDAIWWIFHRVPFVNPVRVATMFSLTIRFIPMIFEEAGKIKNAQLARGIGRGSRPWRRLQVIGFPLILQCFRKVETISRSMISRCYGEDAIHTSFRFKKIDYLFLSAIAAVCAAAISFEAIIRV